MRKSHYCMIGFAFLLAGCGSFTVEGKVIDSTPVATEMVSPTEIVPDIPAGIVGTAAPLIGEQFPISFAGLLYSTEQGLWRVEPDGRSLLMIGQPGAALSPDGHQAGYSEGGDIWLADFASGVRRNLTSAAGRRESDPTWWPSREGVIVFLTDSTFGDGHPGVVNLDGSGYRVLDEEIGGPVAFSADGRMIAFGCCGSSGILYEWSQGASVFDPLDYGLAVDKLYRSAWSPDGKKLAWVVGGYLEASEVFQLAIAIFDLETKKAELHHVYPILGGAMVPHYLAWSPEGTWLAFANCLEVVESAEGPHLWVMRADGEEEHYIGTGYNPVWSPDGQWLAYNQESHDPKSDWDQEIWAVQIGMWEQPAQLSGNGDLEGWIHP